MPGRLYIPDAVKTAIADHIREAESLAIDAYQSGAEDEDVLTGQLGAYLRTKTQSVTVTNAEVAGEWTWSVDYRKFRGRGPRATENILGADGIVELRLRGLGREITKALLFQAKNGWSTDPSLLEQAAKLSTWREAACVVDFRSDGIEAHTLDSVIGSGGVRANGATGESLATFLGTRYLNCDIGDTELSYDAPHRQLKWQTLNGRRVATSFSVGQRVRIKIDAPLSRRDEFGELLIVPNAEVHNHRMYVSPRDLLGVAYNAPLDDVKRAARQIATVWHPDLHVSRLSSTLIKVMNRRMQEANSAYESLSDEEHRRAARQRAREGQPSERDSQPDPAQSEVATRSLLDTS